MSTYSADSRVVSAKALLLVSANSEDHYSLRRIFRDSPWELRGAGTVRDGQKTIRRNHYEIPVVICEHSLPDGDWKVLLDELATVVIRPSLIVCSRLADERLWAEVLHFGAFDLLLGAPFEPEEVLRVTESAWSAWNSAARGSARLRVGPGPARSLTDCVERALAAGSPI